jgi:phospholipid-binding lipoprotein MlaA
MRLDASPSLVPPPRPVMLLGRGDAGLEALAQASPSVTPSGPPAETAEKAEPEAEPYDPFATEEAKEAEDYDPWEPFNSAMFEFNRYLDRYLIKPVAQVWDKVVPDPVERGLSRSFLNLHFTPRFLNNVLQGKMKGAGIELSRFVINSTVGMAGFFDVAGDVMGLQTPPEDTGQTLGAWGIPPGPYLVLPFLPQPFTVRDAFGYVGDVVMNPVYYFLFSTIRVGQPAAVTHQTTASLATTGVTIGQLINERSIGLERFQGVEEATVDLYSAVRNAYLQRRAKEIAR